MQGNNLENLTVSDALAISLADDFEQIIFNAKAVLFHVDLAGRRYMMKPDEIREIYQAVTNANQYELNNLITQFQELKEML